MMRMGRCGFGARLVSLVLSLSAAPAFAACEGLVPPDMPAVPAQKRNVTPEDIVGLRDIGLPDAAFIFGDSPLAVSPDGRHLAFVITRGDPVANRHCRALVVLDLVPGSRPRMIDSGGEFLSMVYSVRGSLIDPGSPAVITPSWSPDGRSLAYRKRIDGRTEAWIASADGSGAHRAARLDVDIEAVAWSADGARLVFAARPGLASQSDAIDREGLTGFLYDERVSPIDSARPLLRAGEPLVHLALDLGSGTVGDARPEDAARVSAVFDPTAVWSPRAVSAGGLSARLARDGDGARQLRITVTDYGNMPSRSFPCTAEPCAGRIGSFFWLGESLFFERREGWAGEVSAIYRWRPSRDAPRRILATTDEVHGCVPAGVRLLCLSENATTPRRIIAIEPASGARKQVYDPNPEFAGIVLGEVRRLKFRNAYGIEAWGDLALPPGYAGGRLPLVVVQYQSRGFLRGGTGDDYPIHAFAARGTAVLSLQRPTPVGLRKPVVGASEGERGTELNRAGLQDWADRRSILGATQGLVAQAVQMGVADPARIGITGLSDGATGTVFALINSKTFAAAAISTCCTEPHATMILSGPQRAHSLVADGFPPLGPDDTAFWRPMSLSRNVDRIAAPILMQLADREYLLGIETWAALKQADKPVEMYVYPDEYHNKWQPAHRLSTYRRSLDWFDYWLSGKRDPDPGKRAQYARWDALARMSAREGPTRERSARDRATGNSGGGMD